MTEIYVDGTQWTAGPQLVYDRLAARAVDEFGDVTGWTVLDAGAGTGGATRELLSRGARVVATDLSESMLLELERQTNGQVPTSVADITALPLPDASYDGAIAAFVLNHLDDPAVAVAELARVTRPGGVVIATTFGADDHPSKAAIDDVLADYGFVPPDWYVEFKTQRIPAIATVEKLTAVGERGGLADASTTLVNVDLADVGVEGAIAYRLGMAHVWPFLQGLGATTREELTSRVTIAVRALPPLWLPMLILRGVSPA